MTPDPQKSSGRCFAVATYDAGAHSGPVSGLIATHNGYRDGRHRISPANVADYPAIKRHLDKFLSSLTKRQDQGRTPYNLRNCAYYAEFAHEKLFWMQMTSTARFAYAGPNMLCNQKAFMVTGQSLKYLCGILNSRLVTWLIRNTAVTTGMGLSQWDKFAVERVPIPRISLRRTASICTAR